MSLSGLISGALLLLGVGAAVYYGPKLVQSIKSAFTSLADGAKRLLEAPKQALDYLQASHELRRNPDQLITDPVTGERMGGYFGVLSSQGTREQQAAAAAARAKEPSTATIKRLQEQKALLLATQQPYVIDLEAGGIKLTLDDLNKQLAALGVT